jgi:hypothetical protein
MSRLQPVLTSRLRSDALQQQDRRVPIPVAADAGKVPDEIKR